MDVYVKRKRYFNTLNYFIFVYFIYFRWKVEKQSQPIWQSQTVNSILMYKTEV